MNLEKALYASNICSYAQEGLSLIKTASDENDWGINLADCVKLWKGGSSYSFVMLSDLKVFY